eukprot:TRINITY_DN5372_c0_g2_i2.p1 TRINITY_DN5372_c0_g2~~TRINITY_DN5372_c0_g2_i2.p1  ORF type:complete len:636 (-),score=110.49 TRINITY_DN5372_c0_g2_i2:259-2166(-)
MSDPSTENPDANYPQGEEQDYDGASEEIDDTDHQGRLENDNVRAYSDDEAEESPQTISPVQRKEEIEPQMKRLKIEVESNDIEEKLKDISLTTPLDLSILKAHDPFMIQDREFHGDEHMLLNFPCDSSWLNSKPSSPLGILGGVSSPPLFGEWGPVISPRANCISPRTIFRPTKIGDSYLGDVNGQAGVSQSSRTEKNESETNKKEQSIKSEGVELDRGFSRERDHPIKEGELPAASSHGIFYYQSHGHPSPSNGVYLQFPPNSYGGPLFGPGTDVGMVSHGPYGGIVEARMEDRMTTQPENQKSTDSTHPSKVEISEKQKKQDRTKSRPRGKINSPLEGILIFDQNPTEKVASETEERKRSSSSSIGTTGSTRGSLTSMGRKRTASDSNSQAKQPTSHSNAFLQHEDITSRNEMMKESPYPGAGYAPVHTFRRLTGEQIRSGGFHLQEHIGMHHSAIHSVPHTTVISPVGTVSVPTASIVVVDWTGAHSHLRVSGGAYYSYSPLSTQTSAAYAIAETTPNESTLTYRSPTRMADVMTPPPAAELPKAPGSHVDECMTDSRPLHQEGAVSNDLTSYVSSQLESLREGHVRVNGDVNNEELTGPSYCMRLLAANARYGQQSGFPTSTNRLRRTLSS